MNWSFNSVPAKQSTIKEMLINTKSKVQFQGKMSEFSDQDSLEMGWGLSPILFNINYENNKQRMESRMPKSICNKHKAWLQEA